MTTAKVYDEFIDFIAAGSNPETVVAYKPSDEVKKRAWNLLTREQEGTLSSEEASELAYYVQLEHILRLAKARARKLLAQNYAVAPSE
jgi:hypothetical protein